ncbi:class I SAM-dependent methyltransferase [Ectobacillus antri]|uniref:class I SAM-dependent methyltransferase n=1 Tax=Ectobacillus antri TaxID=2486280 RepID=UPI0013DE4014|nr:class I SAM-dependent methyltransferase [Ectobacillus antri]
MNLYQRILADHTLLKGVAYYYCKEIGVHYQSLSAPSPETVKTLKNLRILSSDMIVLYRELGYACYEHYRQCYEENVFDQLLMKEGIGRQRILDLCCGAGATINNLTSLGPETIYAIDKNQDYIDFVNTAYPHVITYCMDAHVLPLHDHAVDYVICRVALQYLYIKQVLKEIYRTLDKDGKFFGVVHGSGYILDYLFNRKMLFHSQTWYTLLPGKKQSIQQGSFLMKNNVVKIMKEIGFSKVSICKDAQHCIVGILPVYFAVIAEK